MALPSETISLASMPSLFNFYSERRGKTFPPSEHRASGPLNLKVGLLRADITTLATGAIVNAANGRLKGGGGVDGAIHRAAGPMLLETCKRLAPCKTGSAVITPGFDLPCSAVIHAVGPVWGRDELVATLLTKCYRRSFELAEKHKLASVAFCAISTGAYGYPSVPAARVALREVRRYLVEAGDDAVVKKVILCVFTDGDQQAYEEQIPKVFPPTGEEMGEVLPPAYLGDGAEANWPFGSEQTEDKDAKGKDVEGEALVSKEAKGKRAKRKRSKAKRAKGEEAGDEEAKGEKSTGKEA
ncbi:MAG: hypothetical protein M1832_004032 [Thelocarpon impressellum]|nr:MAG: hypothetical protein M1832_004032 [Thelocarpon impressellum]